MSVVVGAKETQFNKLMQGTYRKVFNLAYRLSGHRSDAEDLTQEAFYRAYRAFGDYEGHRPFENWIYRIVTRLFLDSRRAIRRRVQTISYDAPLRLETGDESVQFETADHTGSPEGLMMGRLISEELEAVLMRLTPEQRLLVWLADVEEVSYSELADMFGTPVGTIRSRLHRAHRALRNHLQEAQASSPPVMSASESPVLVPA